MAEITRLTPSTLAAFNSFPDVYQFFQTVLEGEVTNQFSRILGLRPRSGFNQMQFRRYVLYAISSDWACLLGFWMPESGEEFPLIGVEFQVNGNIPPEKWNAVADVFKQVENDTKNNLLTWKGYNLDKPKTWATIVLKCSFSEILAEEDHVAALRQQLLIYLGETKRILEHYPALMPVFAPVQTTGDIEAAGQ